MKRFLSLTVLILCLSLTFSGCVKPSGDDEQSESGSLTESDSRIDSENETVGETEGESWSEDDTEQVSDEQTESEVETESDTMTDTEKLPEKIQAVKDGAPQFTIIYDDTANSDYADYLANTLKSKTGVSFKISRNPGIVEGAKIYVGLHDAVEGIYSFYGETISYNGYGVVYKDGDIYICGYNITTVSKAAKKFLSEITADHVVKNKEAYIPAASFTVYNPKYEINEPELLGVALPEFTIARGTNDLATTQLVDMCAGNIGISSGAYVRVEKSSNAECRIALTKDSALGLLDYSISTEGKTINVKYGGVSGLYAAFDRLISMLDEDTSEGIELSESAANTLMKDVFIERESDTDIRIMSFNLMGAGLEESYQCQTELRGAIAAEYIRVFSPDSVGMQEFNPGNLSATFSLISDKYELVEFTDSENGGRMKNSWVATAYLKDKYTVKDSNAVHIMAEKYAGDPGAQDYYFTWVLLEDKTTGEQYIHANLHLDYRNENADNGKNLRLMQCEKINAELALVNAKYPNAVIAMTGDYNSRIDHDVFDSEKGGLALKCASLLAPEGKSHDDRKSYHDLCIYSGGAGGSNSAIDHVLVSDSTAEVLRHSIVSDSFICHSSDHYPVVVDIKRR